MSLRFSPKAWGCSSPWPIQILQLLNILWDLWAQESLAPNLLSSPMLSLGNVVPGFQLRLQRSWRTATSWCAVVPASTKGKVIVGPTFPLLSGEGSKALCDLGCGTRMLLQKDSWEALGLWQVLLSESQMVLEAQIQWERRSLMNSVWQTCCILLGSARRAVLHRTVCYWGEESFALWGCMQTCVGVCTTSYCKREAPLS